MMKMKRLILLIVLCGLAGIVNAGPIKTGSGDITTVTDAISATDSIITTIRIDTAIVIFDMKDYTKFALSIITTKDTSFAFDTVYVLLQYQLGEEAWAFLAATLDTVVKFISVIDTTNTGWHGIDTLPPFDRLRFLVINWDSAAAALDLVGNEYDVDCKIGLKGWK